MIIQSKQYTERIHNNNEKNERVIYQINVARSAAIVAASKKRSSSRASPYIMFVLWQDFFFIILFSRSLSRNLIKIDNNKCTPRHACASFSGHFKTAVETMLSLFITENIATSWDSRWYAISERFYICCR